MMIRRGVSSASDSPFAQLLIDGDYRATNSYSLEFMQCIQ